MATERGELPPFEVKDCALAAIATGLRVQNLREFCEKVQTVHLGSIFYHFWGCLLRPRFQVPEFMNDFAQWAKEGLGDQVLAERLAMIDPARYSDLEDLRLEVLEVAESRLDELDHIPWARLDDQFHFLRCQVVVFDTGKRILCPEELPEAIAHMSLGSIFYHFIDARRRTPNRVDDFTAWLEGAGGGYEALVQAIRGVTPHFVSLAELRSLLSTAAASAAGVGGMR